MRKDTTEFYSYHTFIFPFCWEMNERTNRVTVDEQGKIRDFFGENNTCWELIDRYQIPDDKLSKEKKIEQFANYQYFHESVREALYGDATKKNSNIVNNYRFKPEYLKNGARYIISKAFKKGVYEESVIEGVEGIKQEFVLNQKEFILDIDEITLKIFNTGVGVFVMDCKNDKYPYLEDIKMINDYGRRIALPFIPKKENKYYWTTSICADSLQVEIPVPENPIKIETSFRDLIIQVNEGSTEIDLDVECDSVCNCITGIMEAGSEIGAEFTSASNVKDKIHVRPILDERMYVMCLANSGNVSGKEVEADFILGIKGCPESFDEYLSKLNKKQEDNLYAFAYVDSEDATCQSKTMRRELLETHNYDRWIGYGTLYTITAQAFNCICNFEPLINTFRTQYKEMCILTLIQRASLVNFQDLSLKLSSGLEKRGEGLDNNKIKELLDLQERFIAFQNQINFREISSQEQAVDLYEMLRKASYVEELNTAITEQLDALYDATNTNQDFNFNKWALILALVALAIDIPTFLFRADGTLFFNCKKDGIVSFDWGCQGIEYSIAHIIIALAAIFFILHKWDEFKRDK